MDGETLTDLTIFKPLDAARFADRLSLAGRGAERGATNLPDSSSDSLDEVETDIIANVVAEHTQVRNDVLVRLRELNELIATARATLVTTDLENRVAPMIAAIEQRAVTNLLDLQHQFEREAQARATFKEWRRIRKLTGPAKDPKSGFGFFADLYIIAIVEGGANLFFFTEGNAAGMVGAFFQALLIAAANILLCSVMGFALVKRINSVFFVNKVIGVLSIAVLLLGLPTLHVIVGFYRIARKTLAATHSVDSPLWTAVDWARNLDFRRLDELSMVMILVGIVAGGYAVRKGYEFGDRYPDYTKRYNESETHRDSFLDMLDEVTSDMLSEQEEASKAISTFLYEVGPAIKAFDRHTKRKQELAAGLKSYEEHLGVVQSALLSRYRDANRSNRATPAPPHFDTPVNLQNRVFNGSDVQDETFQRLFATDVDVDRAHEAANAAKKAAEAQLARIQKVIAQTRQQLEQGATIRND